MILQNTFFEKDKKRWLEGYDSLEAYNDDYTGLDGHLHGYFLILNPDTGDTFDDKLNKLEMDYGMVTICRHFKRIQIFSLRFCWF